jgi:hypothetical protein
MFLRTRGLPNLFRGRARTSVGQPTQGKKWQSVGTLHLVKRLSSARSAPPPRPLLIWANASMTRTFVPVA